MQAIHTDQAHHPIEPLGDWDQTIPLREETVKRLDSQREAGQSYDDLVTYSSVWKLYSRTGGPSPTGECYRFQTLL